MNIRKVYKKTKGITLIALVITIIILLILSGISITALSSSGLFEEAKRATEETRKNAAIEKVKLSVMASYGKNGKIIYGDKT